MHPLEPILREEFGILELFRRTTSYVSPEHEGLGIRRDAYGALIKLDEHANRHSTYGWEKAHIIPKSRGGTDDPSNKRALHWRHNLAERDLSRQG